MQKTLKRYFPIFVLPTLLAFAVAFLIPFVMGIYLSFCNFTTVIDARFTGISNYTKMFSNQDFLSALSFTARFTVVSVILINAGAFLLALALTKGIKGTNLYRTVFFMPNLIGGIVLGYIWQLIINAVLLRSGVTITTSAKYGFWGLVILMGWQMIGYMMIIYIAGIQNISTELMEAAKIDGATNLQILGKITIPLVMPSITICLFLTLTNSFKPVSYTHLASMKISVSAMPRRSQIFIWTGTPLEGLLSASRMRICTGFWTLSCRIFRRMRLLI